MGVLSTALLGAGSAWTDTLAAQALSGHVLFGGLTLEGSLLSLEPLQAQRAGASLTLTARVGYTGEHWSLTGGPVVNVGYSARPAVQVLPSIDALRQVGPVSLRAGLFDLHGLVPAHVGVSWRGVGIAYESLPDGSASCRNVWSAVLPPTRTGGGLPVTLAMVPKSVAASGVLM